MNITRRQRRLMVEEHESRSGTGNDDEDSELVTPVADSRSASENPRSRQTRGSYHSCNICGKYFSRSEHLSRHLDSHRNRKRWPCQFCEKRFSRRDVLNRHFSKCKHAIDVTAKPVRRVNRACQNCSKRKIKCSGHKSCTECVKLSVECCYPFSRTTSRFPGHAALPINSQTPPTNDSLANSLASYEPSVPATGNSVVVSAGSDEQPPQSEATNCLRHQSASVQDHRPIAKENSSVSFPQADSTTSTAFLPQDMFHPDLATDFINPDASWAFNFDPGPLDWLFFDCPPVLEGQDPIIPSANVLRGSTNPVQATQPQTYFDSCTDKDMPSGLELAQIDPLRHHHNAILHYLVNERHVPLQQLQWLSRENMGPFIKAYFIHFHKHSPIIHLPHWSIASCGTPMVFSMILLAALYIRDTRVGVQDSRKYCSLAYEFAMRSDQNLREPNTLKLETLQSIFLLALLDRILANGIQKQPQISFHKIVELARENGYFEDLTLDGDPSSPGIWEQWSFQESRRRTTFVLYCFDAITSVLLDERPSISTYEMHIMMPSPEDLFTIAARDEWVTLYRKVGNANTVSYSVLLSLLHSEATEPIDIPCTIMGCFVLVHGILLYAWETGKHYANSTSGPSNLLKAFKQKRYSVTQHALREWHKGWQATLQYPYCSVANSAGLYRERSLVYWYLAGILSFPNAAAVTNDRNSTTTSSRRGSSRDSVPVKLWMQRLISCLENGQLDSSSVSFETAQQFVECVVSEETHKVPIGSLLFPENGN